MYKSTAVKVDNDDDDNDDDDDDRGDGFMAAGLG
jgi:hypothetical protein